MQFRDAVKYFRSELGLTQNELAAALHVNYVTVARWERGKNLPSHSISATLIEYARARQASEKCLELLTKAVAEAAKDKFEHVNGELYTVEHSSLSQLVDSASFPIYVCDLDTDELLYFNGAAQRFAVDKDSDRPGVKCYEYFYNRSSPCSFCHKNELKSDSFIGYDSFRPESGTFHRVQGKKIRWCGREAQVRYVTDMGASVSVTTINERAEAYKEQLRIRKQYSGNVLASARYNLTKNTVSDVECSRQEFDEVVSMGSVDEILGRLNENRFAPEDKEKMSIIRDRASLIQAFYEGKTHIRVKHYIKGLSGYFEGTFDLMQNPVTYDVEAFATLRDITDATVTDEIVNTLLQVDYEAIATINAETGEPRPYKGARVDWIIERQKAAGDNAGGVAEYLRKYCADDDVESVIEKTRLSYIKNQLETQSSHTVTYSMWQNGERVYKRAFFAYLGSSKTTIMMAVQNVTRTYGVKAMQGDKLALALKTIQDVSGLDIARYDLSTKAFYSNCSVTTFLGYGEVIENVPDTFINDGHVAPRSIHTFRSFYDRLCRGETSSMTTYLHAYDRSFHLFKADARIIRDNQGEPRQAVIVFQDLDELRAQSETYRRIKSAIADKDEDSYVLYRFNLTRGAMLYKFEGGLHKFFDALDKPTLDARTADYVRDFVHEDDANEVSELLNASGLILAYSHGVRRACIDFREKTDDAGKYRWIRLSVVMAQYPDCSDIEVICLFETAWGDKLCEIT